MNARRIIPCLDVIDGRVVVGEQFKHIKDVADPMTLAKTYEADGADDLIIYNISAMSQGKTDFLQMIEAISQVITMPLTVGGGLQTLHDIEQVLLSGADRVSINSSAIHQPRFLQEATSAFGSERVVCAIDAKQIGPKTWHAFTNGGKKDSGRNVFTWAQQTEALGVSEIILNCIDADGVKEGYNIELNRQMTEAVHIPVIASGGAGQLEHFATVFTETNVSGALAASVFHYGDLNIHDVKQFLHLQNIAVKGLTT